MRESCVDRITTEDALLLMALRLSRVTGERTEAEYRQDIRQVLGFRSFGGTHTSFLPHLLSHRYLHRDDFVDGVVAVGEQDLARDNDIWER